MQKQVLSIVAGAFTLGAVLLSSPGAITPAAHAAPEASVAVLFSSPSIYSDNVGNAPVASNTAMRVDAVFVGTPIVP